MSARPSIHSFFNGSSGSTDQDVVEDNSNDEDSSVKGMNTKNRNRRASEGSYLIKGEGKKSSQDLRCDTCGKGYKHSSCLTKHMWVSAVNQKCIVRDLLIYLGGNMILHGLTPPNF